MATGVVSWSRTAASNATADSNVNWAEGMAPSQVNDSARAMMASAALWRDDMQGGVATAGTSGAFTITSFQGFAALASGLTVAARMHVTSDVGATLAVDGLAAKAIQVVKDTNLTGGELAAGTVHRFRYSSASTSWLVESGIGPANINYFQIQNVSTGVLLGNGTTPAQKPQEITIGAGLSLASNVLSGTQATTLFTPNVSLNTGGSGTYTTPTNSGNLPLYLYVRMVGGGGGGGATATNSGSSGTDTSFGTWTAIGASGGGHGASGAGGAGGSGGVDGTGTRIRRFSGQAGGGGSASFGAPNGGNSSVGGAGPAVNNSLGAAAVTNSGSGGAGGNNGTNSGGGGGGAEYVEFQVTSPAASYSFTVGAGGNGGSAGGQAGGNGAAGFIEIIAHWQ